MKLRPVLTYGQLITPPCEPCKDERNTNNMRRVLNISPRKNHGSTDIIVNETKREKEVRLVKGKCKESTKNEKRQYILHFDGKAYSIPEQLKFEPDSDPEPDHGNAVTAPLSPINLKADVWSGNSITGICVTLTWTDISNNESGFNIYQYINNQWVKIRTVAANITTFTHAGLKGGTCFYRVSAYNSAGENGTDITLLNVR